MIKKILKINKDKFFILSNSTRLNISKFSELSKSILFKRIFYCINNLKLKNFNCLKIEIFIKKNITHNYYFFIKNNKISCIDLQIVFYKKIYLFRFFTYLNKIEFVVSE